MISAGRGMTPIVTMSEERMDVAAVATVGITM